MRNGSMIHGAAMAFMITLMACEGGGGQVGRDDAPAQAAGELRVAGTVRKAEVGVNCWRFEGSDGTSYELLPAQAPSEVLSDGKAMTLMLLPRNDLMSTCMVGQIVDVVRVITP